MATDRKKLALALAGLGDTIRAGAGPNVQPTFVPRMLEEQRLSEAGSQQLERAKELAQFQADLKPSAKDKLDFIFEEGKQKELGKAAGKSEAREKFGETVGVDLTAEQQNKISIIRSQFLNIRSLREDLNQAPQGPLAGRFGQSVAFATGGRVNPATLRYEKNRKATAAGLYRALTGDTRLSDADAASRAEPLLPDLADDEQFNQDLLDTMEKGLLLREKMMRQGIGEISLQQMMKLAEASSIDPFTGEVTVSADQAIDLSSLKVGGTFKGGKIKAIREKSKEK